MSKLFRSTGLLAMSICLFAVTGFAQQDQAALPPAADTEETPAEKPADQEVEVNEDNYRQFMELKDPMQQRSILPEDSYQSRAGLQKLDKLPEDSQKHLRNQLREIILQGEEWQPGDEEQDYPYVPSAAAANDPSLQRKEAEAWGELVDGYHAREAEIYENSSRSAAAAAAASGTPGAAGGNREGTGADGKGQDGAGQGRAAEQAGQPGSSDAATTADSYSPNSQSDPASQNTSGVSQNAMEFLKNAQQTSTNTGDSDSDSGEGENGQAGEQQQDSQQDADEQPQVTSETASPSSPVETSAESTEGTSQNALEYLTGENVQSDNNETETDATEGTLSINDLLNAQGVDGSPTAIPQPAPPNDEPDTDPKASAKEKGG